MTKALFRGEHKRTHGNLKQPTTLSGGTVGTAPSINRAYGTQCQKSNNKVKIHKTLIYRVTKLVNLALLEKTIELLVVCQDQLPSLARDADAIIRLKAALVALGLDGGIVRDEMNFAVGRFQDQVRYLLFVFQMTEDAAS
jgi:hypothetical protein